MAIEIINLRKEQPVNSWDFKIDRTTPVGNPFNMDKNNESQRKEVCDQYEKYFDHQRLESKRFGKYLNAICHAYFNYGKLRLFCWCAPKRCHGETIKFFIEEIERS